MFCPECGSEYVEDVARCSDCRVDLVAQLPELKGSEGPLKLVRVSDATGAPMIEELLRHNGIDSIIQGEESASVLPAAGELTEVRIWVRDSDAARARELITAFFDSSTALPSEDAEGSSEDAD